MDAEIEADLSISETQNLKKKTTGDRKSKGKSFVVWLSTKQKDHGVRAAGIYAVDRQMDFQRQVRISKEQ